MLINWKTQSKKITSIMKMLQLVLFGLVIIVPFSYSLGDVGDSCQVARSGAQGICKIINECPDVIDDIVKHGLYPTQCGFRGHDQIVCCPAAVTITTTTTPRPTRISQRSAFNCFFFLFFYSSSSIRIVK